jgi:hypothetical protein
LLIYVTNHTQYHIGRDRRKKKDAENGNIAQSFSLLFCFSKKKRKRDTQKKNQKLIQKKKKEKSEINKQQEYACRQKDVCVENKWIKNNM